MGLSKSQRICILLAIDGVFFVIELVVGYTVHSLALVADSFHMLNDVLSLCVGLWAVRVANQESSSTYTYGWQRAETLGALINGVFLVALCLSIFLEAIQRFFEPQVVSNPKLVLIVGCLGLASNILGLALFHDHSHGGHGHSHGGEEGHSHGHDHVSAAEEGHGHSHSHDHSHAEPHLHKHKDEESRLVGDESGSIEDVLPQVRVGQYKGSNGHARGFTRSDEDNTTISNRSSNTPLRRSTINSPELASGGRGHRRRTSASFGRGFGSVDNIQIHPASFRQEIIAAGRLEEAPESDIDDELLENGEVVDERSRLTGGTSATASKQADYGSLAKRRSTDYHHDEHHHNKKSVESSSGGGGHSHGGHSHGDLNMRGVFLHVAGDALGNIGVIATALIIWLTTFEGRYYFDPAISLIITIIILHTAIPLCKAASRILLQAVPVGLSIDEIKNDIQSLPRVIEAHHVHVWQLSDSKLVASLHVKVDCEIEGTGSASYMHLAREIRRCLHGYGIHSSTIQPEFTTASEEASASADVDAAAGGSGSGSGQASPKHGPSRTGSKAGSLRDGRTSACLLDCGDNCEDSKQCCPPTHGDGHK